MHRDQIQVIRDKEEAGEELTAEEKKAISGIGTEEDKKDTDGTKTTYSETPEEKEEPKKDEPKGFHVPKTEPSGSKYSGK